MNDLNLPPRCPLPPVTRDRLRARVIGVPAPHRAWTRVPLAAAAAVAVLAAGTVIVAQSVGGDAGPATPPAPTTPAPPSGAERCYQAAVLVGQEARYPDRDKWRRVAEVSEGAVTVTAFRDLGDRPYFCATTRTSVVISNPYDPPTYVPGTRTGSLLTWSSGGIYAGVADPSWTKVGLLVGEESGGSYTSTVANIEDGLFMYIHPTPPGWVEVLDETGDNHEAKEPGDGVRLPPSGPPPVRVEDRRTDPAGAAEFLTSCLARSKDVPDPSGWRPGAFVAELSGVVMARNGDRVGMCRHLRAPESTPEEPLESYSFTEYTVPATPVGAMWLPTSIGSARDGSSVVVGVVSPSVETLRLRFSDNVEVDAQVVDGTFVAVVPPGTLGQASLTGGVAKNGSGKVVHDGVLGSIAR